MKFSRLPIVVLVSLFLVGGGLPIQPAANFPTVAIAEAAKIPQKGTVTRKITVREPIAFTIKKVDDPKLEQGTEKIKRKGKNGTKTFKYKVTYTDGKEVSRELISEKITKKPREQIVRVGTKKPVAPQPPAQTNTATTTSKPKTTAPKITPPAPRPTNSTTDNQPTDTSTAPKTYKNIDGDTILSPYHAPSAPAGASAQCRDGTYSFSAHRQGTCSHHGGVAQWL